MADIYLKAYERCCHLLHQTKDVGGFTRHDDELGTVEVDGRIVGVVSV